MKIISKIKIHPIFYVTSLIILFTGFFKNFYMFLIILLFHELGHILMGILFKWKIKNIIILPFGALTIFDEGITKPLIEEFIITIMGPMFQIIIYLVLRNFYDVTLMHYGLLIFNLLPIIPLDGSKIINIILNLFFPFKISLNLTILLSFVLIASLGLYLIYQFNFVLILVLLCLFVKVLREFKDKDYTLNRFFYERYYFPRKYLYNKIIIGNRIDKMFKEYKHIFKVKNNYYTEHEILRKRFDFKDKL